MTEPLVHAPDLPYDASWRNIDRSLSFFDDLQGYVVLMHFFCSSSRHCHNSLATTQWLQRRFGNRGFQVIHVHSPRFDHEAEEDAVEPLLQALAIEQPLIFDPDKTVFEEWQAHAWPYLVLVDAGGRVRFAGGGEPDLERVQMAVQELLDDAAAEGDEPYHTVTADYSGEFRSPATLCAPGGLCFDDHGMLWVADTGNHRLVCVDPDSGLTRAVVGGVEAGNQDGGFAEARFFLPRSLAARGREIWVVDAGNHQLRRVDLESEQVSTELGTGRAMLDPAPAAQGREQGLHSPSGVAVDGDAVLVASAAQHQLLRLGVEDGQVTLLCGSGNRGLADGLDREADFAHPQALCLAGRELAVLDGESSALRVFAMDRGEVRTLVGGGLQDWGDADGEAARFQDPRGLARHGEDWLVADTGNDKLRRVDARGRVRTLGVAGLLRPEALAVQGEQVFIADTGRHRIVRLDLQAGESETLTLRELPLAGTAFGTDYRDLPGIELDAQQSADLSLPLGLGRDEQLDLQAELLCELHNLEGECLMVDTSVRPEMADGVLVLRGIGMGEAQEGVIAVELSLVSQRGAGQVGHSLLRRFRVPVTLREGAAREAQLTTLPV